MASLTPSSFFNTAPYKPPPTPAYTGPNSNNSQPVPPAYSGGSSFGPTPPPAPPPAPAPAPAPAAAPAPAPAPTPAPTGGGGGGGVTVPKDDGPSPMGGLRTALQASGAGWQQSGIAAGQQDLGTRTPPVALDILRQIVAARGRAY